MFEKISSNEQYYFLLAKALVAAFDFLGGADKYRPEFNYLTNPVVRKGMQVLNKRVLRFLANIYPSVIGPNQDLAEVYKQIVNWNEANANSYLDEPSCEDAFYKGLHGIKLK